MQLGNGQRSAWVEMYLPATGVMMSFCAKESRVRMLKFMLRVVVLLDWLVGAMLVRIAVGI